MPCNLISFSLEFSSAPRITTILIGFGFGGPPPSQSPSHGNLKAQVVTLRRHPHPDGPPAAIPCSRRRRVKSRQASRTPPAAGGRARARLCQWPLNAGTQRPGARLACLRQWPGAKPRQPAPGASHARGAPLGWWPSLTGARRPGAGPGYLCRRPDMNKRLMLFVFHFTPHHQPK